MYDGADCSKEINNHIELNIYQLSLRSESDEKYQPQVQIEFIKFCLGWQLQTFCLTLRAGKSQGQCWSNSPVFSLS